MEITMQVRTMEEDILEKELQELLTSCPTPNFRIKANGKSSFMNT